MKTRKIVLIVLAATCAACLGSFIIESQTKVVHRLYDDVVLDNYNHYLPCEALPAAGEAEELVRQHEKDTEQILAVNPGLVGVEMDTTTCPGRADMVIWYASHADRMAIEALLGGKTFHGIPVRLVNR